MKLLTIQAELKALRTICGDLPKLSSSILGSVNADSFYYNPVVEGYKSVMRSVKATGSAPDWIDVISDPGIAEDARKILKGYIEPPAISKEKAAGLVSTLDKYRKLRALVKLSQNVLDNVEDKSVDLDELLDATSESLAKARSNGSASANLHHFGKNNNTTALIKEMLYGKTKPSVPTGFRAFDEQNGGILLGSLWTIGANTGGGKTALAINVLRNITEFAAESVCIVPLEMTAVQTTDRLMGILAGIDVGKISQKRLSKGEKTVVKRAYSDYVKKLKELDTKYTIYEPQEDLTIEETLLTLKPFGYKVILIDYISLLKGADGDDQWRQLGNIARFSKMFAKNNNCIVCLLCQVGEEGRIRYAQAIAEHSNNCWVWTMPGEESETSIMDIRQLKARNQRRFNFQLLSHNSTMLITDVDDVSTDKDSDDETSETSDASGNKEGRKIRRYLKDVNEDRESD